MLKSLFYKVAGVGLQLYLKETPTQVFSCETCEIFKNTHFEEHPRAVASRMLMSTDEYPDDISCKSVGLRYYTKLTGKHCMVERDKREIL